ncbi:hypothetical protein ACFFUE_01530 [Bergeyella porcorum]|uniref:hypothetical protein n=1 Tax=Bergeyella porcorum TaxID=1735111 RepID=UPI0035E55DF1
MSQSDQVFSSERRKEQSAGKEEKLYQKIGQLQIEIDFLKKLRDARGMKEREKMIDKEHRLSLYRQCNLLCINQKL